MISGEAMMAIYRVGCEAASVSSEVGGGFMEDLIRFWCSQDLLCPAPGDLGSRGVLLLLLLILKGVFVLKKLLL